MFSLFAHSSPAAELACRHPLASVECLKIWLTLSLPFVAGGGAWATLALLRQGKSAPSRLALHIALVGGVVFAFITATALAVGLDVWQLHAPGGVELALFLVWVLALEAGYVRLVLRLWRRDP
ncbi:MAG: hypothetical protein OZ921_00045 [Sorangiineae bacterium]|nr:hypothetical protein [Polyangiaceae bacterium]MEB2320874.1 hypothetical protein [Sorangiineae bacterium]